MSRLLTVAAIAAGGLALSGALGVAVGTVLHNLQHRHAADADLSAYIGMPSCPCGTFDWDTL